MAFSGSTICSRSTVIETVAPELRKASTAVWCSASWRSTPFTWETQTENVTDLHPVKTLLKTEEMERKSKQELTSRSLSPTFTPALAAGPSADTLEMKIPWTNKQTNKTQCVTCHYKPSQNYSGSRSYLIISLVRCRSFPTSNADAQTTCLSLNGDCVLKDGEWWSGRFERVRTKSLG